MSEADLDEPLAGGEPVGGSIPIERTSFDLGRLSAAVDAAAAKLDADRDALERRIAASVAKMKVWRFAGMAGLALGVLALPVGVLGAWAGLAAQDANEKTNSNRAEARVTACVAFNRDVAANVNALNDRGQELLQNIVNDGRERRTPEQQIAVDEVLRREVAAYEELKIPDRDCTPRGIAEFYNEVPPR